MNVMQIDINDHIINAAGIDHDKEVSEARQEARDEYSEKNVVCPQLFHQLLVPNYCQLLPIIDSSSSNYFSIQPILVGIQKLQGD
jgi:hypothetical protein